MLTLLSLSLFFYAFEDKRLNFETDSKQTKMVIMKEKNQVNDFFTYLSLVGENKIKPSVEKLKTFIADDFRVESNDKIL